MCVNLFSFLIYFHFHFYSFEGYVVSMRALNGEWQDMGDTLNSSNDILNNGNGVLTIAEECSSTAVQATECSLRSYDALQVICSSTPSLDPCKYTAFTCQLSIFYNFDGLEANLFSSLLLFFHFSSFFLS